MLSSYRCSPVAVGVTAVNNVEVTVPRAANAVSVVALAIQ